MNDHARGVDRLVALITGVDPVGSNGFGWDAGTVASFQDFVRRNQLSGFLHTLVDSQPSRLGLPEDLQRALRRRHAMESRKRAVLHRELAEVIAALRNSGIEAIQLKGPQLAARFYGAEDRRAYWDLDLLVRKTDLTGARRVLEGCGFHQKAFMLFGERLSLRVVHALDFGKGEVDLDLHWELSHHPSLRIDYDRLWQRRSPWEWAGCSTSVLSVDYELTANLLSALKDIERGAFRLRSFVDLWMILGAADGILEWEEFFAEREQENVQFACVGVLALFLLVFRAGERFPKLSSVLQSRPGAARIQERETAIRMLEPTLLAPARRLWATRLYQMPPARHLAWWAATLPVRLNVYKPGKLVRLSRWTRGWL